LTTFQTLSLLALMNSSSMNFKILIIQIYRRVGGSSTVLEHFGSFLLLGSPNSLAMAVFFDRRVLSYIVGGALSDGRFGLARKWIFNKDLSKNS
jgi:hypothetical protein